MQIWLDKVGFSYTEPMFPGVTMTIAETRRIGMSWTASRCSRKAGKKPMRFSLDTNAGPVV